MQDAIALVILTDLTLLGCLLALTLVRIFPRANPAPQRLAAKTAAAEEREHKARSLAGTIVD